MDFESEKLDKIVYKLDCLDEQLFILECKSDAREIYDGIKSSSFCNFLFYALRQRQVK